ncbi:MAG: DUF1802 family protein [Acidobacteria bacterium]|nr:DUF1802 family protein [Acidobacteriota bacterium]
MNIALKEWAIVIEALAEGHQTFLLRKGGIAEGKRGFELLHRRFLLFPTWEHQHRKALQPQWRERFDALASPDPSTLELRYLGEVRDIVPAPSDLTPFLEHPQTHVWTRELFEKRYGYRPDLPLFLVAVQLFELPHPIRIPFDRRYQGCRSWVTLYEDVPVGGERPTQSDAEFVASWNRVRASLLG